MRSLRAVLNCSLGNAAAGFQENGRGPAPAWVTGTGGEGATYMAGPGLLR